MLKREKERIKQLVAEFDNVRKELDQEIRRYESEKRRMVERIQKLENSKVQSEKLKQKIRQWNALDQMLQGESSSGQDRSSGSASPVPQMPPRSASYPILTITSTDSEENEPPSNHESLMRTHSTADPETLKVKNAYLVKKNAELTEQMAQLKLSVEDSIKRTVSKVSQKSSSCRSELSPGFSDLATDLNQVRLDLETLLTQIEEKPENVEKSQHVVQWQMDKNTDDFEADRKRLEKALERSREERTSLTTDLDRVTSELHAAWRELELFRNEPREEATLYNEDYRMQRSRSVVEMTPVSVNGEEHQKWKEKAGVMFRELNRLRKQFAEADVERRDLRAEVKILKGEVEMVKAQAGFARSKKGFLSAERSSATPMSSRHRRDSSGTYATARMSMFSLHDLPSTSEPDLTRNLLSNTDLMSNSWHERAAYAEELVAEADRRQMNLEAELNVVKEAFRKQLTTLRLEKKGLEDKVKELEETSAVGKKKVTYNDELVEDRKAAILRKENELYEKKIRDLEEERQEMYLVMFKKGQQAAQHDLMEDKMVDQLTEDRIVLRFLHDAFYYYLLNKGDSREHLQAMMTMLNFTSSQKDEVYRHRRGSSHH
ncbi:hypothetical protein L596_014224 [Steinernema carpocapsae]|uniref:GRIP domain-containing protein n=1 Tax=Steinernema carpocapsae TaxID=34508 RepID=A0A4V6A2P3_STECR|nr:hypothetical protein L596_014224 [Steinernema carpocapsae]